MTKSKLGTSLGPGEVKNQEELKFTDYSINKFQSDFSSGRKKIEGNFNMKKLLWIVVLGLNKLL